MSYRPPTIEQRGGLKNHLGEERYNEFVKRVALDEPDTIIGKAIGVHRKTIPKYRAVYHREQGLTE